MRCSRSFRRYYPKRFGLQDRIHTTTATKAVPTTVHRTVAQLPAETITQTQPATVTSTLVVSTVTKTVFAEPSNSGSSDGSVVGWIPAFSSLWASAVSMGSWLRTSISLV